jgi:uncharacterized protein YuzE
MEGQTMSGWITLSVDTNVGAAYIKLSDEQIVETVEVTPSVQVDIDATGTVVGVELLTLAADLPIEVLNRTFHLPAPVDASILSNIRPSIGAGVAYASSGQAYVPTLQPV